MTVAVTQTELIYGKGVSDVRVDLVNFAKQFLGNPYVWGGSNPNTSFDCSGFVSWVLTQSGVCNTGRLGARDSTTFPPRYPLPTQDPAT